MALFEIPTRGGRSQDTKIAKKATSKAKSVTASVRGGNDLATRISNIQAMVFKYLGKYENEVALLRDETEFHNFITTVIESGIVAIDTETTGLDPLQDKLVGFSLYSVNSKAAYIPMRHRSYITNELSQNQISSEVVKCELQRLKDAHDNGNLVIVMFNAKFDMRVLKNQGGVPIPCDWDCYLAARLLNENEGSGNNGLKKLHQKYVQNGEGDAFNFESLFGGMSFDIVPIKSGYIYAAMDAKKTYEYYLFQKEYLGDNASKYGLEDVAWVFHNVEMPCVQVVADMEDNGITFDNEYANKLSVEYHNKLNECLNKVHKLIKPYEAELDRLRLSGVKIDDPINIDSTTQLPILLYDVMKLDAGVDKRTQKPVRSTGEEILSKIDNDVCKAILEYRGITKLLSTYIDKLPKCVNPNDGRIHCSFNQYGADTGRFSSSDPNLQLWACA